jgi:5-oxoprolinase (ATP-hydrolysing) subunit C
MTLQLIEPGLLTLIQGVPFRTRRHLGLPLAGAADPVALALANWLVGNEAETAALETTYAPLSLRAEADCVVAAQGAALHVEINGQHHTTHQALSLSAGDVLTIPPPAGGCRSCIAVRGGFMIAPVLNATSTYTPARLGGLGGSMLSKGAMLQANPAPACELRTLPKPFRLHHSLDFLLRVTVAPESHWIMLDGFCNQNWKISRRANRIGIELDGTSLKPLRIEQLVSSAVFPGTIQCPPSGLPFLLGPDAQTTGGYPRIAQVIRADRHLIGQLRPGAHVRFKRIEPAEARSLYRSKIALIRQLQPDFRLD